MSSTPDAASETASAPMAMVLDLDHLHEQTLGDGPLEADLLMRFAHQARTIVRALTGDGAEARAGASGRADLLHLLCGSARAIGAWDVALHAETLEAEARRAAAPLERPASGMAALAHAVQRACEAIDRRQAATRR